MASLPMDEWLHLAKRLPVGGKTRVFHRREGRPNLVVGNEAGKWWAYCQACKLGGVVEKDHVRITGGKAPESSVYLDLPRDMLPILDLDEFTRDSVLRVLADKNMDQLYLPPLHFSESRKRLLIQTEQGWLGRDTTGASHQKWLTYDRALYLEQQNPGTSPYGVVVEDPFSYYKVRWALRDMPEFRVYSALGTVCRPACRLALTEHQRVILYFDGDSAGTGGARREARALRGLGTGAVARCAPDGLDPKDCTIGAIRDHVREATASG